jgi:hypothetical protein
MRRTGRIIAVGCLIIASLLGVLTLVTWDPGGLFFGLPFIFLVPGAFFLLVGLVLLLVTRRPKSDDEAIKNSRSAA